MRPPRGFEDEKYPLRHRLIYGCQLGMGLDSVNTVMMPIVMSSSDTPQAPSTIIVNPHNSTYETDTGPLVHVMSIIDRMRISLKFNMTSDCESRHLSGGTAGPNFDDGVYTGHDVPAFKFLWRPVFNVYPEKLDAADDFSGTTVATILSLTKDATNEDIVPLTTNKLPVTGPAELNHPISSAYDVQAITDFNMTSTLAMEDHVFDEDLLQTALKHYTNKGALRSCFGRTRHVTLTRNRPFANFYLDKFVPNAIRRVQPYGFFAIQVHLPVEGAVDQMYVDTAMSATYGQLGIKMIANYHEWNFEHNQNRGTPA